MIAEIAQVMLSQVLKRMSKSKQYGFDDRVRISYVGQRRPQSVPYLAAIDVLGLYDRIDDD